jgi:hypothetical protein
VSDEPKKPELHRVGAEQAGLIWEWFQTRGGLALWRSIDLSDPGKSWTCPLFDANGVKKTKPTWKADEDPYRIIKDPSEVIVETYKEVRRFRVAIRPGAQGLSLKLTDFASEKVRKAVRKAGENATYTFDYMTQEAVIFVPDTEVPLVEWAEKNGRVKKQEEGKT